MQQKKDERPLNVSLTHHGLEFVGDAVELLSKDPPSERQSRHAVVLLATGIELLLKSRLVESHWSLVVDKLDDLKRINFDQGDFKSAGHDQCIKRLTEVCGVDVSKKTKETFKGLADYRNRIVHFSTSIEIEALRVRAFAALSELHDFIEKHCRVPAELHALRESIRTKLHTLEEYVAKRRHILKPELDSLPDGGYFCHVCDQRAVKLDGDGGGVCLFCNEGHYYLDVMMAHMRKVHGGSSDLGRESAYCPSCAQPSVIQFRRDSEAMRCMSCLLETSQSQLRRCRTCVDWVVAPEPIPCPACNEPVL